MFTNMQLEENSTTLSQVIDKLFRSLTDVFNEKLIIQQTLQEKYGHHSHYYSEFQVLLSLEFATCKVAWGFLMTFVFLITEITATIALWMQTIKQVLAEISVKFSFTRQIILNPVKFQDYSVKDSVETR